MLLVAAALAMSLPASAGDGNGHGRNDRAGIEGPSTTLETTSFSLCYSSDKRGTYEWSGPGITGSTDGRCVDISGLTAGSYTYTLEFTPGNGNGNGRGKHKGWGPTQTFTHEVDVVTQAQVCDISGPTAIEACSDAEACAPKFDGVHYTWTGVDLPADGVHERCLDLRRLTTPGPHTLELEITGMGSPVTCSYTVTVAVGTPSSCLISGPARVARGSSFDLCGPDVFGNSFAWDGKRIPDGTTTRCVTIPGNLSPGRYSYTLQVTNGSAVEVCSFDVTVVDSSATCFVSGPSEVFANQPFELCGPPEGSFTYSWRGTGVTTGTATRCIDISGLEQGLYTYHLTLNTGGVLETCSFDVRVTNDDAITVCPQPLGFWRQNCGSFTRDGFLSDADFARVASCVDDRSGLFNWTDDVASFNAALDARTGKSPLNTLRQQYIVLLANLCAADLQLVNATGDSIGLRLDTSVECGGETTTIADLLASLEDLITGQAARSGLGRWWCSGWNYRYLRAIACVSRINAGQSDEFACSIERVRERQLRGLFGNHSSTPGLEPAAQLATTIQLRQPSPNPFSSSTRMQYVAPAGGAEVNLAIYDLTGRLVQRLVNGRWDAGVHEVSWNATDSNGQTVRPGMYFLRGNIGEARTAWRLMYVK